MKKMKISEKAKQKELRDWKKRGKLDKKLLKKTSSSKDKDKNSIHDDTLHSRNCKHCDRIMQIDVKYDTGVCWVCVAKMTEPPKETVSTNKINRVRGWQFMAIWVDPDGTVYEKGVENPKLKGKHKPSDPKKIRAERRKVKKGKQYSDADKRKMRTEIKKLKDQLKKEKRKTYKTQIKRKIKSLQKKIG